MSMNTTGVPAPRRPFPASTGLAARLLRAVRRAFELAGGPYADGPGAPM
ncbi:hypothetical protein [uncultured Massilia sp.]|nr:hypothetical protein [uncultured Massilia sp.]